MSDSTTYNGWKNYATWGVALILDNDEGTYRACQEHYAILTQDVDEHDNVLSGIWTRADALRFDMADWLRDFTETLCGYGIESDDYGIPEPSMMARQLLGAAMSDVDFDEIADHYIDEEDR